MSLFEAMTTYYYEWSQFTEGRKTWKAAQEETYIVRGILQVSLRRLIVDIDNICWQLLRFLQKLVVGFLDFLEVRKPPC